jgi:hypothetical protein
LYASQLKVRLNDNKKHRAQAGGRMIIKAVERSAIEVALKKFDEEYRHSSDWQGWETSKAQRYAIEFGGQLYPPKQIISLATGLPVSQFSGSPQSNNYLADRDFNIVSLQSESANPIVRFEIGKIYDRKKHINGPFGGSIQSGIAPSSIRTLYKRSKAVKDYVLMRAGGQCEACKKKAPFVRANGTPYLEPHHTTRLSDGGADHPRYVGAICPDCHREIHYGKDGVEKNKDLQEL